MHCVRNSILHQALIINISDQALIINISVELSTASLFKKKIYICTRIVVSLILLFGPAVHPVEYHCPSPAVEADGLCGFGPMPFTYAKSHKHALILHVETHANTNS